MTELNTALRDALEAAYKEALPDELETVEAESTAKHSEMGLAMPMGLLGMDINASNFCSQWTEVRGFLMRATGMLSWIMPKPAAMAKAFIKAFESTLLPVVCPIPTTRTGENRPSHSGESR